MRRLRQQALRLAHQIRQRHRLAQLLGRAPRRGGGDKPPRYTTEQIITALRKAGGIQARAAKLLKCDRSTICKRIAGELALQLALADITETQLDDAEDVLATRMRDDKNANSQLQAVTFYLKTKGRARIRNQRRTADRPGARSYRERRADR